MPMLDIYISSPNSGNKLERKIPSRKSKWTYYMLKEYCCILYFEENTIFVNSWLPLDSITTFNSCISNQSIKINLEFPNSFNFMG